MKPALPFLLIAAAAPLAGCGGAQGPALNEQQAADAEKRAPDAEKVLAERWAAMFAHPEAIVSAASDMSLKTDGYKPAGKGYAATGAVTLPEAPNGVAVETHFEAAGTAAAQVDTIRFTFDVKHAAKLTPKSRDSYRFPPRIVNGFLARFEVGPGDAINGGLNRFDSAKDNLHGVAATVDVQPIKGGDIKDRHITVTFTRSGASAPANQTQGK